MRCNYYCFAKGSGYYAIDTVRLIPLQLSKDLFDALYALQNKNISQLETLEEFAPTSLEEIEMLVSQNILIHTEGIFVKNSFRELSLSFSPTLMCNLNCKYCYSNRKEEAIQMDLEVLDKAIDFFCDKFDFSICRVDFVSGGEPLINKNALIRTIDFISKKFSEKRKRYFFWICTNGTLIDQDIIKQLDQRHCNLGISLDGPKINNDINRVFKSGGGTYDCVTQKICQVLSNPNLSRNIKNLWNSAVITPDSCGLSEIVRNAYNLGFRNLQMKVLWSADKTRAYFHSNIIALFEDLSNYLYSLLQNDEIEQFLMICNENDTFGKMLLRIIIQSGVVRRCNAGINKFSVSPEGRIFPCDSFMGSEKYCIGDIYNGFNNAFNEFREIRNYNVDACSNCWARNICGGDCMYNSFINTGKITIPDEEICIITKAIIEMCVKLIVDSFCNCDSWPCGVGSCSTSETDNSNSWCKDTWIL